MTHPDESAVRVPPYYLLPRPAPSDILELADALWPDEHNFNRKDCLKYLCRAGRKPGQSAAKDITKLLRCAARELRRLGGDVPEDL